MKFSIFKTKRTVQVVLVYKRTSSTTAISRKVVGKSAGDNPERVVLSSLFFREI